MGVCVEVSSKICNNGVHDRRCEDKEDNVISFVWGGHRTQHRNFTLGVKVKKNHRHRQFIVVFNSN